MNKLFSLIYVHFLNLFDINKIMIARNDGVKSNLEKKSVLTGLMALFFGYVLYKVFGILPVTEPILILNFAFFLSSALCFISNVMVVEPILFKNEDNEILLALPVTRYQILFSKLFVIYLRNLIYTAIIMIAMLFSYVTYVSSVSDVFMLMYILSILAIPLLPIVFATILAYFYDYFKLKIENSFLFQCIKYMVLCFAFLLFFFLFKDVAETNISNLLFTFIQKIKYIYPILFLFENLLLKENIFLFLGYVGISILVIYIYTLFITNHYLKMCSMLKGIKKNKKYIYKKKFNFHQVGGMFRKEMLHIVQDKVYFRSSFLTLGFFSILLFICLHLFHNASFEQIENFSVYVNTYLPLLLAMLATFSNAAISSFSLEKDNLDMLLTMPVGMWKIILGKWLPNFVFGIFFVLINGCMVWFYLDLDFWVQFYCFLLPFVALLFVSFTSLLVDYRFIEKNETDDNIIIKQRIIVFVPMFLSLLIGIGPFFIPLYKDYELLLGSYTLLMLLFILGEMFYLFLYRKKLLRNLIR